MTISADLANRLGRQDLAAGSLPNAGSTIDPTATRQGIAANLGGSIDVGRFGLIILAGLVVGLAAFGWWTK